MPATQDTQVLTSTLDASPNERATQYVQKGRPDGFDAHNETAWFNRAVALCQESRQYQQQYFVADVIHTHIRELVGSENFGVEIQDGLIYDAEPESLINDFVYGIENWSAFPLSNAINRTVQIKLHSVTPDTAVLDMDIVGDDNMLTPPEEPGIEKITPVDCTLKATVNITKIGWEGSAGVSVIQRQPNDGDTDGN